MQIVIDIDEKKYKSICDHFMFMHQNEVMFSVKNGTPLDDVLEKIRDEIKNNTYFINETTEKEGIDFETVEKIINKYKAESEVEE